jgi:3-oxoacyl-[acyl-carrier protein] reductase
MDLQLSGRIAVVTGASIGIGRGIAKVLAMEGAQVVAIARRADLLATLAQEIVAAGHSKPLVITADLVDRASPSRISEKVIAKYGHVDILVNNAGGSRPIPIDADDEQWDEGFAVNFTAVRKMTQAFLPSMQSRNWGRIVNITGSLEPRNINAASAAKAGVHIWSKGLAAEVGKMGITVNCLAPGRIHSEQIDNRLHPTAQDQAQFAAANIPLGYFGDPDDMAYAVAFLCSPKARYITGQRMYVDGGMHRAL